MRQVYLDYSATTPVKQEVIDYMIKFHASQFGNPSSVHSFGIKNKNAILKARTTIANAINADKSEIYFTSSGTEADNWAIKGVADKLKAKGKHIISSKIEHHAVLHSLQYLEKNGYTVTYLDVDKFGKIDIQELKESITDETILVSIMYVNNEIGTVQDVAEIGQICQENNVYFHTDAVQAFGNFNIDVKSLNIDLMSISSHKIYGPKGVGALYIKKGVEIENLIHGGAQERSKRSGTENLPAIMGFSKAVELAYNNLDNHLAKVSDLRDYLKTKILTEVTGAYFNGHAIDIHPAICNISFDGIEGESLFVGLDMKGVAGSTGSACNSGSIDPSHVLQAIGLSDKKALSSIRLTVGDFTTKEDIDYTVNVIKDVVKRLRA